MNTSDSNLTPAEWESMYSRLRELADGLMGDERNNHTLTPTALVHEAFVRMQRNPDESSKWANQMHFRRTAVKVMRNVLVDHARKRSAAKRGGAQKFRVSLTLFLNESDSQSSAIDILELEEVLTKLEKIDARMGRVVEMRLFGNFTVNETAEIIGVSRSTVENDWTFARAWLRRELFEHEESGE